jgi:hypothetical protein
MGGDDLAPPIAAPVELDIGPVETHAEMHDEKFDDAFEGTEIRKDPEGEQAALPSPYWIDFDRFRTGHFYDPYSSDNQNGGTVGVFDAVKSDAPLDEKRYILKPSFIDLKVYFSKYFFPIYILKETLCWTQRTSSFFRQPFVVSERTGGGGLRSILGLGPRRLNWSDLHEVLSHVLTTDKNNRVEDVGKTCTYKTNCSIYRCSGILSY